MAEQPARYGQRHPTRSRSRTNQQPIRHCGSQKHCTCGRTELIQFQTTKIGSQVSDAHLVRSTHTSNEHHNSQPGKPNYGESGKERARKADGRKRKHLNRYDNDSTHRDDGYEFIFSPLPTLRHLILRDTSACCIVAPVRVLL